MNFKRILILFLGLLFSENAVFAQNTDITTNNKYSTSVLEKNETVPVNKEAVGESAQKETTQLPHDKESVTLKKSGWFLESDGSWYFYTENNELLTSSWKDNYYLESDGKMAKNKWVDNHNYYVDSSGLWVPGKKQKSGWNKENGYWYFYENGEEIARNKWIDHHYVLDDGKMAEDKWVDDFNYYVDSMGVWVPGKIKEYWVKLDATFFYYENGKPVKNAWRGDYYLQEDGSMATSKWVDNGNYYVDSFGKWDRNHVKKQGWLYEDNQWYFYEKNEQKAFSKWIDHYYVLTDGKMAKNQWVDHNNYFVDESGKWVPGKIKEYWVQLDGIWYYYENSRPVTNVWRGDYYLESDGKMAINKWVENYHYFVGENGKWIQERKLKKDWVQENGKWYFYEPVEKRVKNAWRGDYYLGETGEMLVNQWIDNDKYYVDESGRWIPEAAKGKEGWIKNDAGDWQYFFNGIPIKSKWIDHYYLLADGKMAINQWVDNYKYYVDLNGVWIPDPSTVGNQKELLLELARGYIGVEQFDDRHQYMVNQYNSGPRSYSGYRVHTWDDWCDIFVSSMFQMTGIIDLIGKEAYVPYHIRLLKQRGIWIGKATPQPGDIVTFDWNVDGIADHIAIIEKVEDDKIITIEGNTSYEKDSDESKVLRKSHKLTENYIVGYARPQYR